MDGQLKYNKPKSIKEKPDRFKNLSGFQFYKSFEKSGLK